MDNKEKIIKDAQYRKGLSISYFNSLNAAIELFKVSGIHPREENLKEVEGFISGWRDWFLDEHMKYYAEVIARVGIPYDAKESIKKLAATTTLEELQEAWLLLSEDERRDELIVKVKNNLKQNYEKV